MLTKTYLTLRFSPPVASTPLSPVRVHKFSSFTCVNRKQVLSFTPYIVANNNVLLSHSISYYLNSLRNLETRGLTRHFVANNSSVACASSSFPSLFFSSSDSKEEANTSKAPFAKFRRRKTRRLNKPRVSPRNENESLPTITSSENDSLPNIICSDESPCKDLCVEIPHTTADCDTGTMQSSSRSFLNFKHIFPSPIAETIEDIVFVILVLFSIPLALSLISGFRYFLQLCESDKKTVLMLQVGILDKSGKLRRQLAQIEDTFHFDDLKLKEVVKALIQHSYSFRYAYVSAIQCLSDEEKNYGDNFAIMMRSISDDPPALVEAYRVLMFYIKSFAIFIHWGLRKTSKKINYDTKCSKGLFAEVLTRELAKYDKDEEALACIDGMKYEEEAVGEAHSMVDNNYLVVTILVLASGVYSIPPLQCNTDVKTVLQKFSSIPKSKTESLKVLLTPRTEDEGISEQGLQRNFPLLKPLTLNGLEN